MTRNSVELCPPTQEVYFEGPAVAAAGFRPHPNGLHCVQLRVSRFRGTVYIEGSLNSDSTDGEWFPVIEPIIYPRVGVDNETSTTAVTFVVNCVWLRIRVDRRYLIPSTINPEFVAQTVGRFESARLGF